MKDPHWTWERLRDFFADGGKISYPSAEDLFAEIREPLRVREDPALAPGRIRLSYGGGPGGGKSAAIEDWLEKINHAMGDIPIEIGVDLAFGLSEAWLVSWDAEAGKMIYRRVYPADMVRRDLAGEGSPENGSD